MTTVRRRLLLLPVLALLCAGCGGGVHGSPQPQPASVGPLTLRAVARLPKPLSTLGVDGTFALPAGWRVDGFGVERSGRYLVFSAIPVHVPTPAASSTRGGEAGAPSQGPSSPEQTWVVDSKTGRTSRFPQINPGWYAGIAVPGAGWVLREERQQLSGVKCGTTQAEGADCYLWRLYAQPLPTGRPRLLAQSEAPGPQAWAPLPVTNGRYFVWEQGESAGRIGVYRWTPGAVEATELTTRKVPGQLNLDGRDGLYITEGTLSPTAGANRDSTYRVNADVATTSVPTKVAAFSSAGIFDIRDGRIAYSTGSGEHAVPLSVLTIGSRQAASKVGPAMDGYYAANWIDSTHVVTWAASGFTLLDLRNPGRASAFAPDAVGLVAPRTSDGYLDLGYAPPTVDDDGSPADTRDQPSVIAWKRVSP